MMSTNAAMQVNLFTGEPEPSRTDGLPETGWLFDPDFGIVLPQDVSGREIAVAEGVTLAFPVAAGTQFGQVTIKKGAASVGMASVGTMASGGRTLYLPGQNGSRQPDPELWVAQTEDAAQLILSGFGIYLGKKSERLQIKLQGKVAYEFPFFRISEVVVASRGVSLSSDLLKELCEHGIRLTFVESSGRPYAMLSSPVLMATVASRREQLLAYNDERGLELARLIVRGKIRNQRHLLLYFGKYLKSSAPERYASLAAIAPRLRALEVQARGVRGDSIEQRRDKLMGLEGVAGRLYWEGVKAIVESKAEFAGRVHQGASDPFNSLLNYGYGILYAHVWGAVVNAGLEPFAGYLHVDRPGKPSLVLDMVEEFRQPVVDRTVIAFTNLAQPVGMNDGMLDEPTKRALSQKILERLASREPFHGQQYQIRSIIQMQARSLVGFLRGKGPYRPFSFRW
ncbi:MAG TPA: CRISPR-associated endonuclease Cas1 [Candidatus Angelobacter sp.]